MTLRKMILFQTAMESEDSREALPAVEFGRLGTWLSAKPFKV
jgi:hypothetical protein